MVCAESTIETKLADKWPESGRTLGLVLPGGDSQPRPTIDIPRSRPSQLVRHFPWYTVRTGLVSTRLCGGPVWRYQMSWQECLSGFIYLPSSVWERLQYQQCNCKPRQRDTDSQQFINQSRSFNFLVELWATELLVYKAHPAWLLGNCWPAHCSLSAAAPVLWSDQAGHSWYALTAVLSGKWVKNCGCCLSEQQAAVLGNILPGLQFRRAAARRI